MNYFWTTSFLLLAAAAVPVLRESSSSPLSSGALQDETPDDGKAGLKRRHPQTNLLFDLPDDFLLATDWRGYVNNWTESSILISESDSRPLEVLKKGFFDPKQLSRMNRKIVSREDCEMNGLPAIKVEMTSERDGNVATSWAALFGDADGSCMILGTAFKAGGEEEAATVKNAVFTVDWDRPEKIDPFDHVDYTLDTKVLRILKFATKDEGMVMFTFGGSVDYTDNPGRPKLEVRKVMKKLETPEEREALMRAQLAEAPNLRDFKVDSIKEIEINGLKGLEGWASGVSETHKDLNQNDMTVTVLQVTLFDEDAYYSMSGIIATLISKNWLQMYQAGIHSFQRKATIGKEETAREEEETPTPPKEDPEDKPSENPDEKPEKQGD